MVILLYGDEFFGIKLKCRILNFSVNMYNWYVTSTGV